jgi:hypothetical protein
LIKDTEDLRVEKLALISGKYPTIAPNQKSTKTSAVRN